MIPPKINNELVGLGSPICVRPFTRLPDPRHIEIEPNVSRNGRHQQLFERGAIVRD
jgi:hypothetical protein